MSERRRFATVGLGARMAVAGGRAAWSRLALMATGIGIGIALLLAVAGVEPAVHASNAREAARWGIVAETVRNAPPDVTLLWSVTHEVDGRRLRIAVVRGRGEAPVPPGLERIPDPGELLVSPALADDLGGPFGSTLRAYLGGLEPSGTIAPDGLAEPGEWYAYLGKPTDLELGYAFPVTRFEPWFDDPGSMALEEIVVVALATVGLLLPIGVFVATATRLSAATREGRYAAVRLAGATHRQLRGLIAVEAGLASIGGVLLGLLFFQIGRTLFSDVGVLGERWFPNDLWPGASTTVMILVVAVVFSIGVSLLAMHRVEVTPLGVSRRSRIARRRWPWPIALGVGLALLGWAVWDRDRLAVMSGLTQAVLVAAGLVLVGVGLAGTASLLAWLLAARLAVRARASSFLLAMRRLETDTGASGRVVATVALLIAFSGVAQAVTASNTDAGFFRAAWATRLPDDAVVVTPSKATEAAGLTMAARLESIDGVRSLTTTHRLAGGGRRPGGLTLIVRTDGSPATLDRIRMASTWSASVETPAEIRAAAASRPGLEGVSKLLNLALLFLLVVCGATVLVASVDWMSERRRTLAVLSAVGVPGGVLRRSVMAQIAVPLLFALAAGATGALAVTWLLFTAVQEPVVLAGRQLATTTAVAAVMVLVTTAATLPWLRIARNPELLRNE